MLRGRQSDEVPEVNNDESKESEDLMDIEAISRKRMIASLLPVSTEEARKQEYEAAVQRANAVNMQERWKKKDITKNAQRLTVEQDDDILMEGRPEIWGPEIEDDDLWTKSEHHILKDKPG